MASKKKRPIQVYVNRGWFYRPDNCTWNLTRPGYYLEAEAVRVEVTINAGDIFTLRKLIDDMGPGPEDFPKLQDLIDRKKMRYAEEE